MNPELDPSEVGARLHGEFALLTEPPPPPTQGIVAAGRRRRRNRMLTAGTAVLAVIAATAITVPMALRADPGGPTIADGQRELTWTWDGRPREGASGMGRVSEALPPPGDRREWLGWLTDTELGAAVRAAVRVAAPGLRIDDEVAVSRTGPFLESGASAVIQVTSADGRKGFIEAGVFGKAGGAQELAGRLATTGKREIGRAHV